MSDNSAIPPKLEPASVPENSDFYVHSKTEIISMLRDVQEARESAALFFGGQSMLTSVLKVSSVKELVYLDCNINKELNALAVASKRLTFVSTLHNVKIQFEIPRMEFTEYGGQPAFVLKVPKVVLRLQRRESFRISTPTATPITCSIPLPSGNRITAVVVDISAGGLAIFGSPEEMKLDLMAIYRNCLIVLPDLEQVHVDLQVRGIFDISLKNNVAKKRVGLQFIDIPNHAQSTIQRYIMKLQMEQRAKSEGGKWQ